MKACREEKKFCAFEQSPVTNKKYTLTFDGLKPFAQCMIFFPAKRLSIFLTQYQTPFKSADFFSRHEFSRQKTYFFFSNFFSVPIKSFLAAIVSLEKYFPAKRLSIFLTQYQTPFKSADFFSRHEFSRQKTFFFFSNFFSVPIKSAIVSLEKYFPAKRLR